MVQGCLLLKLALANSNSPLPPAHSRTLGIKNGCKSDQLNRTCKPGFSLLLRLLNSSMEAQTRHFENPVSSRIPPCSAENRHALPQFTRKVSKAQHFASIKKKLCMMPQDFFDCICGDAAAVMVQPWQSAQKAG